MRTLRFLSREFDDKRLTFFGHGLERTPDTKFRELKSKDKNGSNAQSGHILSLVVKILLRNTALKSMCSLHLCHRSNFVHELTRGMVEMAGERSWLSTK